MSCLNNYNLDVILKQLNCWCENWRGQIQTIFPSGMTQIEQIQQLFTAVKNTASAQLETMENFCELYKFVHDYFDNLDVQNEINSKLEEMIEDGTFANVITPLIVQYSTPHFVESTEEMTNHSYIYVLASTGNVWTWNGKAFIDTGIEYIGGINNILRNYGVLPTDNDLNNITQNSAYILVEENTYINSPVELGTLLTFNYTPNLAVQFAYDNTYGTKYYRSKTGGNWGDWMRDSLSFNNRKPADLNDAEAMTLYIYDSSEEVLNRPVSESIYVYTYGTIKSTKMQYAVAFSSGNAYLRVYSVNQSKWLEWYNTTWLNGGLTFMGTYDNAKNIDTLESNTIYVYDSNLVTIEGLPENASGYIITIGGNAKFQLFVRTLQGRTFVRTYNGSVWSEWFTYGFQYLLSDLSDCNKALPNGFYILNAGEVDNLPIEQTGYLFCFGTPSSAKIQFYVVYATGEIFYRRTTTPFSAFGYTNWVSLTKNDGGGGFTSTAKMFSIGNSILTGSVWVNGSYNHLANYGNAPYSVIANALQLRQSNVTHTLISSTGLLYNAGEGNFLTNIKNKDLSEYDVLLTHLWTRDMDETFQLGNVNSEADDGTLSGGVVSLVNYVKSSNGMCQLILVGVPPVSTTIYGDSVFTGVYPNGSTLEQCNEVMKQLADKYHFIYVDWKDLNLSYYYHNYTDDMNVHANNEDTYRVMGAYLAGRVSAKLCF